MDAALHALAEAAVKAAVRDVRAVLAARGKWRIERRARQEEEDEGLDLRRAMAACRLRHVLGASDDPLRAALGEIGRSIRQMRALVTYDDREATVVEYHWEAGDERRLAPEAVRAAREARVLLYTEEEDASALSDVAVCTRLEATRRNAYLAAKVAKNEAGPGVRAYFADVGYAAAREAICPQLEEAWAEQKAKGIGAWADYEKRRVPELKAEAELQDALAGHNKLAWLIRRDAATATLRRREGDARGRRGTAREEALAMVRAAQALAIQPRGARAALVVVHPHGGQHWLLARAATCGDMWLSATGYAITHNHRAEAHVHLGDGAVPIVPLPAAQTHYVVRVGPGQSSAFEYAVPFERAGAMHELPTRGKVGPLEVLATSGAVGARARAAAKTYTIAQPNALGFGSSGIRLPPIQPGKKKSGSDVVPRLDVARAKEATAAEAQRAADAQRADEIHAALSPREGGPQRVEPPREDGILGRLMGMLGESLFGSEAASLQRALSKANQPGSVASLPLALCEVIRKLAPLCAHRRVDGGKRCLDEGHDIEELLLELLELAHHYGIDMKCYGWYPAPATQAQWLLFGIGDVLSDATAALDLRAGFSVYMARLAPMLDRFPDVAAQITSAGVRELAALLPTASASGPVDDERDAVAFALMCLGMQHTDEGAGELWPLARYAGVHDSEAVSACLHVWKKAKSKLDTARTVGSFRKSIKLAQLCSGHVRRILSAGPTFLLGDTGPLRKLLWKVAYENPGELGCTACVRIAFVVLKDGDVDVTGQLEAIMKECACAEPPACIHALGRLMRDVPAKEFPTTARDEGVLYAILGGMRDLNPGTLLKVPTMLALVGPDRAREALADAMTRGAGASYVAVGDDTVFDVPDVAARVEYFEKLRAAGALKDARAAGAYATGLLIAASLADQQKHDAMNMQDGDLRKASWSVSLGTNKASVLAAVERTLTEARVADAAKTKVTEHVLAVDDASISLDRSTPALLGLLRLDRLTSLLAAERYATALVEVLAALPVDEGHGARAFRVALEGEEPPARDYARCLKVPLAYAPGVLADAITSNLTLENVHEAKFADAYEAMLHGTDTKHADGLHEAMRAGRDGPAGLAAAWTVVQKDTGTAPRSNWPALYRLYGLSELRAVLAAHDKSESQARWLVRAAIVELEVELGRRAAAIHRQRGRTALQLGVRAALFDVAGVAKLAESIKGTGRLDKAHASELARLTGVAARLAGVGLLAALRKTGVPGNAEALVAELGTELPHFVVCARDALDEMERCFGATDGTKRTWLSGLAGRADNDAMLEVRLARSAAGHDAGFSALRAVLKKHMLHAELDDVWRRIRERRGIAAIEAGLRAATQGRLRDALAEWLRPFERGIESADVRVALIGREEQRAAANYVLDRGAVYVYADAERGASMRVLAGGHGPLAPAPTASATFLATPRCSVSAMSLRLSKLGAFRRGLGLTILHARKGPRGLHAELALGPDAVWARPLRRLPVPSHAPGSCIFVAAHAGVREAAFVVVDEGLAAMLTSLQDAGTKDEAYVPGEPLARRLIADLAGVADRLDEEKKCWQAPEVYVLEAVLFSLWLARNAKERPVLQQWEKASDDALQKAKSTVLARIATEEERARFQALRFEARPFHVDDGAGAGGKIAAAAGRAWQETTRATDTAEGVWAPS
jgi:hypothetical protein